MAKKERVLTDLQQKFLNALLSDECKGNIKKAMRLAGYAETTQPHEVVPALREEIIEAAQQVLAINAPVASWSMVEGMLDPNALGTMNKIKAAREVLDRVGIIKPESDVNLRIPEGGIIILPAKKKEEADVGEKAE